MPAASFVLERHALPLDEVASLQGDDLAECTGVDGARSFAAVPLRSPSHGLLGSLCVVDRESRAFLPRQLAALGRLAASVVTQAELGWQRQARDATPHEHAQRIEWLDSLFRNSVAAVFSCSPEGLISSVNPAAEHMLGYGPGEMLGLQVNGLHLDSEVLSRSSRLNPPPDPRACLWQCLAAQTGSSDLTLLEWSLQRKNGTSVPTMLTVSEFNDAQQHSLGYVGIAWDIAERHRLEKLKAEFISTVSHELRTPLTAIRGALGLICGGAFGAIDEALAPMLDIAFKNSQRLAYLVDDLLDMEKLTSGRLQLDLQPQALMPVVQKAIEAAADFAQEHRVDIVLCSRSDDVQVRVDAERLQQVIVNFLSNAAKFSPNGARVEVFVRAADGAARVEVVDQGPGIPAQFRDRIFQKFSQADSSDTRQKGGTGLGLAISKELIERMNGLIGFESTPGVGTRFHFQLPLVRSATASANLAGPAIEGAPLVLVVEDDPDIAGLIVLMLHGAGIAAEVASTALAALEALQLGRYEAMTLDLLLPDQSGLSLMRHIRDLPGLAKLPVVVVSAYTEEGRHSLTRELAPVDWITKPIDERRLVQALRGCLRPRSERPSMKKKKAG